MSRDSVQAEYYVIRLLNGTHHAEHSQPLYLNPTGNPDCFNHARRFNSIEEAESYLESHLDGRGETLIQRCTPLPRHNPDQAGPIYKRLMDIDQPYRRTAYNWLRGKAVKPLLMQQGEDVYRRHRQFLLDYNIDIEKPSDLVLLKPRKGKIRINTGEYSDNEPRQFIAYPDQRPGGTNKK